MTNPQVVDASPTKEFFVEMLTRDVQLQMAILDLVDNCIDGALRLRGQDSLHELRADIKFSEHTFSISDNCGGIDVVRAQDYAFRFGRPSSTDLVPHSVGRFGVGMKRAIFKMGRNFDVTTRTRNHTYRIHADVSHWLTHSEWTFPIDDYEGFSPSISEDATGTTITITNLTSEARTWFQQPIRRAPLGQRFPATINAT